MGPDDWRLQELILLVVLDELADALWGLEQPGLVQLPEPDRVLGGPALDCGPETVRRRPPFFESLDVGVEAAPDVDEELLLRLEVFVVLSDGHIGLDDDSEEEVLDEQEDEHEVEHRVNLEVARAAPVVRELSKRHLELGLHRALEVGEVLALRSKAPGCDAGEHAHEHDNEERGVPEIVPGLGDGAFEESQARVHGRALDEAEEREDEHDVAEGVEALLVVDQVQQLTRQPEKRLGLLVR
mmetsp:Transcript_2879/g.6649  ORF Transcript_2879/g.6649 Transcript_2879/m.6649 type:complete len:241 (+) Transcript_2879:1209-1931(+)